MDGFNDKVFVLKRKVIENKDFSCSSFSSFSLIDCTFRNVLFDNMIMNNCSFINCVFKSCSFDGANILNCEGWNSSFYDCTFRGTKAVITLIGSDIQHCRFSNALITSSGFTEISVETSSFYDSILESVSCSSSRIHSVFLKECRLLNIALATININGLVVTGTEIKGRSGLALINLNDSVIDSLLLDKEVVVIKVTQEKSYMKGITYV